MKLFLDANVIFFAAQRDERRSQDLLAFARLMTGDRRDFGHMFGRVLRGTRVVTPAMALDLVLKVAGA